MSDYIIEFSEKTANEQQHTPQPNEDDYLIISFDEEQHSKPTLESSPIIESDLKMDDLIDEVDSKSMPFKLPGAVNYVDDEKDKEPEPEPETNWENDRDVKHFMSYILRQYPGGIPAHDGKSTLGCERAISFLNKLNREITEALRYDEDDILDIAALENIRTNIVKDVTALSEHKKKLNKKLKEAEDKEHGLIKEAGPKFNQVVTPFQRAIAGIIINAVVKSGKPFDAVYETLKKKYNFTEREELEILQILMDSGYPILKDRGTVGDKLDYNNSDDIGVEFIKNYFS